MFRMGVFYNGQNPDESVYYMENMPLTSLCPRYCCLKAIDCNALTLIDVKLTEWKCKEPSPYASRAVQLHPNGGQFDSARSSARTPRGAYV